MVVVEEKYFSKAFAIPILTASGSQNRDNKCFRINFSSTTTNELYLVSMVF